MEADSSSAHLKWVPDRLAALASSVPPGVSLSIQIYITSPTPSVEELEKNPSGDLDKRSSQASDDKKSDIRSLDESHDAITIHEGRPEILKLLEAEVKESNGAVSVDGMLHSKMKVAGSHESTSLSQHRVRLLCWPPSALLCALLSLVRSAFSRVRRLFNSMLKNSLCEISTFEKYPYNAVRWTSPRRRTQVLWPFVD